MKLTDFDYKLPQDRIAQFPSKGRAQSKLLVLNRAKKTLQHKLFSDITGYLRSGDILVLNDTRVIPARLYAQKETGGKVEVLLLNERKAGYWEALVRPSSRVREGARLYFVKDKFEAVVVDSPSAWDGSIRNLKFDCDGSFWELLDEVGHVPLPPYIRRQDESTDCDRYQTVFAKYPGAVAAPTAGLHFDKQLLKEISDNGVTVSSLTLHVGYGTFRPVKCENIGDHEIHEEYFRLTEETAWLIKSARAKGGRVIACGTTVARALESASLAGSIEPMESETNLFIYPPYKFKAINALITNFHLPRTTLLMLVSAFAGRETILNAYAEAVKEGYRFYSYGDAMLIL